MRPYIRWSAPIVVLAFTVGASLDAADKPRAVYPAAILLFEERGSGVKDYGPKITDILFAKLAASEHLHLVDREDLKKTLQEQELNLSGLVKPDEATKVGRLTGARILVTGSVVQVDRRIYVVAKIIGTESGRVIGASVDGKAGDDLGPLVEKLAEQVKTRIQQESDKLVAAPAKDGDRVEALNKALKKAKRPTLYIKIQERHVGQATFDPAAQTEVIYFARGAGFDVVDPDDGARNKADLVVTGEGISEFAGRRGSLITVKARIEIKVVDRKTDKVVAVDRQTVVVVDLSEQVAGKTALQNAAADVAERLLPKLVK
jgi:TolB-like protein